jgi:CDP-diglyceride synthetase
MSKAAKYAVSGLIIVTLVILASWPFLDPAGRRGVAIAGAVALPIQVTAFWALLRFRGKLNGFLAAWVGGTLLRMLVIGAVAVFAIRSSVEGAVPMLLALAGFFFGLLMLEPMYFKAEPNETA